jgi:hypothetical protein
MLVRARGHGKGRFPFVACTNAHQIVGDPQVQFVNYCYLCICSMMVGMWGKGQLNLTVSLFRV